MNKATTKDGIREGALEAWTAHGLECVMRPSPLGPLNGYVRLPDSHSLRNLSYDDIDVEVHGGLTYGVDKNGWVGFDTMHLGDWWHEEDVHRTPERVALDAAYTPSWSVDRNMGRAAWTVDRLRAEVERLAAQFADKNGC